MTFGNGTEGRILGIGNLTNDELPKLDNVLWLRDLTSNLISICQLCEQGMDANFNKLECLKTNEKGEVLMKGIKTKENCYLWLPQRKSQTGEQTGMLHTMLEHQVTPKELDLLHVGSVDNEKSISDSWLCKKNSQVSWFYEKQSSDIIVRILESKQLDELRGKFGICPH